MDLPLPNLYPSPAHPFLHLRTPFLARCRRWRRAASGQRGRKRCFAVDTSLRRSRSSPSSSPCPTPPGFPSCLSRALHVHRRHSPILGWRDRDRHSLARFISRQILHLPLHFARILQYLSCSMKKLHLHLNFD